MSRILCSLLTIVIVGLTIASANARTWTDRTGRQVEAEYIGFKDGKIELKRTRDGRTFLLPLDRLSDTDQELVKSQANAKMPTSSTNRPDRENQGMVQARLQEFKAKEAPNAIRAAPDARGARLVTPSGKPALSTVPAKSAAPATDSNTLEYLIFGQTPEKPLKR